jgi:hypothetical protein
MYNKWVINKIAALVVSIVVILAFMRYYRIYNFNLSSNDRLFFWVPVIMVGIIGLIVYVWTFKAKNDKT